METHLDEGQGETLLHRQARERLGQRLADADAAVALACMPIEHVVARDVALGFGFARRAREDAAAGW